MGRDHSEQCPKCGVWFGGLNDTPCACVAPDDAGDRERLANLIHDDQREQCDLDPEGFYDCEQLADRILAAGFRAHPQPQTTGGEVTEAMVAAALTAFDSAYTAKLDNREATRAAIRAALDAMKPAPGQGARDGERDDDLPDGPQG